MRSAPCSFGVASAAGEAIYRENNVSFRVGDENIGGELPWGDVGQFRSREESASGHGEKGETVGAHGEVSSFLRKECRHLEAGIQDGRVDQKGRSFAGVVSGPVDFSKGEAASALQRFDSAERLPIMKPPARERLVDRPAR